MRSSWGTLGGTYGCSHRHYAFRTFLISTGAYCLQQETRSESLWCPPYVNANLLNLLQLCRLNYNANPTHCLCFVKLRLVHKGCLRRPCMYVSDGWQLDLETCRHLQLHTSLSSHCPILLQFFLVKIPTDV